MRATVPAPSLLTHTRSRSTATPRDHRRRRTRPRGQHTAAGVDPRHGPVPGWPPTARRRRTQPGRRRPPAIGANPGRAPSPASPGDRPRRLAAGPHRAAAARELRRLMSSGIVRGALRCRVDPQDLRSSALATHTAPAATHTPLGPLPTGIVLTTWLVAGRDPRQRPVERADHPHTAPADRDRAPGAAHRDRLAHRARRQIDPRDRLAVGVGHPHRAAHPPPSATARSRPGPRRQRRPAGSMTATASRRRRHLPLAPGARYQDLPPARARERPPPWQPRRSGAANRRLPRAVPRRRAARAARPVRLPPNSAPR